MESRRRREMRRRGPMLAEIGVGGDPAQYAAQSAFEEGSDNKSQSEMMTSDAVNVAGQEPKYLREASRFKPLAISSHTKGPSWFPADRPHARTTGDADLPLSRRPYTIRKAGAYDDDERFVSHLVNDGNDDDDDSDTDHAYSFSSAGRSKGNRFVSRNPGALDEYERHML